MGYRYVRKFFLQMCSKHIVSYELILPRKSLNYENVLDNSVIFEKKSRIGEWWLKITAVNFDRSKLIEGPIK